MEERKCLECGEILKGRIDQKFCDDQCRSAYNNRKFSDSYNLIRRVNRTLKKNRKILSDLNPDGKATIPRILLENIGFDFNYHTHTYTNRNGQTYFFCYDQGYLQISPNKCLLVKKEE
ncbi:MAG: hypothetical protein JXR31_03255 [Prolixibacteraceae bacterium]|nr:hypothetical protein [Prolixibacteraceae bacterium]MBN2773240.1 hypothetical protein [Prolixibacteraceae bacterium]